MSRPSIEKLPGLEEYLGVDEKASLDVERIKRMALSLRNLNRDQTTEDKKDSDMIPGVPPMDDGEKEVGGQKFRTFGQQRKIINAAYERLWDQIEEEGYRASVEQQLNQPNGASG
jgi:hypothetical protein